MKATDTDFSNNDFECFGAVILPNINSQFYPAALYHPPSPTYDPEDLIEFLEMLVKHFFPVR